MKKDLPENKDTFILRAQFKHRQVWTIIGINRNIIRLDTIITELETKIEKWEVVRMNGRTGRFTVFSKS